MWVKVNSILLLKHAVYIVTSVLYLFVSAHCIGSDLVAVRFRHSCTKRSACIPSRYRSWLSVGCPRGKGQRLLSNMSYPARASGWHICFTFAGVPGWSLGQVVLSQVASIFSFPRDRFICNTLVGHDRFLSDALLRGRSVIRCCMVSNMGVNELNMSEVFEVSWNIPCANNCVHSSWLGKSRIFLYVHEWLKFNRFEREILFLKN